MESPIQFNVVDRKQLPFDLMGGRSRKYGPLLQAVAELNGRKIITVAGTQAERNLVYAAVNNWRKRDGRLSGVQIAHRDNTLFIFRGDKEQTTETK
jgi:hypothetical protein